MDVSWRYGLKTFFKDFFLFSRQMLKVSAFYLEKHKSFIPKEIFLSRFQNENKKTLFADSIFGEGFGVESWDSGRGKNSSNHNKEKSEKNTRHITFGSTVQQQIWSLNFLKIMYSKNVWLWTIKKKSLTILESGSVISA